MASIISKIIYGFAACAGAGLMRGTGVCFSTWLATTHSASFAGSFLSLITSAATRRENYVVVTAK